MADDVVTSTTSTATIATAAGAKISTDVARQQFERATANGWIPFFVEAAEAFSFPVELLLAIASRETNIKNIDGDGGHGRGIMQIDDRAFPEFANSGQSKDPRHNIHKGAEVLNGKRRFLSHNGVSGDLLLRGSVAAYNAGEGRVLKRIKHGQNIDSVTAHGDYAADVLARSQIFRQLLAS
jgi:soluble lytic murein transglycosylase-like protein